MWHGVCAPFGTGSNRSCFIKKICKSSFLVESIDLWCIEGDNHSKVLLTMPCMFLSCTDMLEGSKSSAGPSPPPHAGAALYGEKHYFHPFPINKDNLTHGPEHYTQQKNLPPVVSALFHNSALEKSGNACECWVLCLHIWKYGGVHFL